MKKFNLTAALLSATLILTACGSDPLKETSADRKTVLTVSDGTYSSDASYAEYRYFRLNNKRDLFGADTELTAEQLSEVAANAEQNILDRHALYTMAESYGITVTDDDRAIADEYVDAYREACGDDDGYRTALTDQYMTDALFREVTTDTTIAFALMEELDAKDILDLSDEAFDKAAKSDELLCLKEIYIYYPDASLKDWALGRAEELTQKLDAGEDFEALMREYSSYSATELPPEHGYYTMKYDALDEIWDVASSLKEGQYSDPIVTDFGVHIVLRAKKDASYIEENREEIYEIFRQSRFYEEFYKYRDTLTVTYTDYGKELAGEDFGA